VRIDLHTHVVPPRWEDFAARYGGGKWPRLEMKDSCHATIMTGSQFFRAIDDRSWSPERRIEDMDRLGIDRADHRLDRSDPSWRNRKSLRAEAD